MTKTDTLGFLTGGNHDQHETIRTLKLLKDVDIRLYSNFLDEIWLAAPEQHIKLYPRANGSYRQITLPDGMWNDKKAKQLFARQKDVNTGLNDDCLANEVAIEMGDGFMYNIPHDDSDSGRSKLDAGPFQTINLKMEFGEAVDRAEMIGVLDIMTKSILEMNNDTREHTWKFSYSWNEIKEIADQFRKEEAAAKEGNYRVNSDGSSEYADKSHSVDVRSKGDSIRTDPDLSKMADDVIHKTIGAGDRSIGLVMPEGKSSGETSKPIARLSLGDLIIPDLKLTDTQVKRLQGALRLVGENVMTWGYSKEEVNKLMGKYTLRDKVHYSSNVYTKEEIGELLDETVTRVRAGFYDKAEIDAKIGLRHKLQLGKIDRMKNGQPGDKKVNKIMKFIDVDGNAGEVDLINIEGVGINPHSGHTIIFYNDINCYLASHEVDHEYDQVNHAIKSMKNAVIDEDYLQPNVFFQVDPVKTRRSL